MVSNVGMEPRANDAHGGVPLAMVTGRSASSSCSGNADELERLAARTFGTEAAVSTVSGSAAVLAVTSCLAVPGQAALVPGWICSGVVHALVHAGVRPLMVDVGLDFGASVDHASALLTKHDVGMAVCVPYGGSPLGMLAWEQWSRQTGVPLLVDVAQTPDSAVWRVARRIGAATVTSFRAGKPLGAEGGGLVAGSHEVVARIRLFLSGGRDRAGRKVGLGLELPMHPAAARAAHSVLADHPTRVHAWRKSTRQALDRLRAVLLPDWEEMPDVAVSRIPCLGGDGTPLHPDPTYCAPGVRDAVVRRLGAADEPELPRLGALYDRIRVVKVTPPLRPDRHAGAHTVVGDVS